MPLWYSTGTIAVTNGSTTVTGAGTAFVGSGNPNNVMPGDALNVAGLVYEIASVTSNTRLTLARPFAGTTASGLSYSVQPTLANIQQATAAFQQAKDDYQGFLDGPLSGLFEDGATSGPGIAFQNATGTGFARIAGLIEARIGGALSAKFGNGYMDAAELRMGGEKIVESGSGWVLFADGTQFCFAETPTITSDTAVGNVYTSGGITGNWPRNFTEVYVVAPSATRVVGTIAHWPGNTTGSNTGYSTRLMTAVSGATGIIKMLAFGRG